MLAGQMVVARPSARVGRQSGDGGDLQPGSLKAMRRARLPARGAATKNGTSHCAFEGSQPSLTDPVRAHRRVIVVVIGMIVVEGNRISMIYITFLPFIFYGAAFDNIHVFPAA